MYPVSEDFLNVIRGSNETFKLEIKIEHSQGTTILYDDDISQHSLKFEEASQVGDEFTVGGVFASNIEFDIINRKKFDDIKFIGAKIYPVVYLLIQEGVDAHFLQSTQPSKMLDSDDKWEGVPLGEFNIDVANRLRNSIEIKAIDNMIFLDRPYSLSKLTYPATLHEIYHNICTVGDVLSKTASFLNMNYTVEERPTGDITLRNILGFVAELSGSFARFDRDGKLQLTWYDDVDVVIDSKVRSDLEFDDEIIQITGISVESSEDDDTLYVIGTDDYAIDLTGNLLLSGNYDELFNKILSKLEVISFRPYSSEYYGNPALQAGDIITQLDVDGVEHNTIITHSEFKYRGTCTLEAKAKSNIVRGFKSTDNRIAKIVKDIERDIGNEFSDMEQAIANATELITESLGGHVLKRKGELLIMDNEDPNKAKRVWRWNLGGLAFTENFNSENPIYKTAMTMDGRIVADFITTGNLSADLIKSGSITSDDGSSHINLETGGFNFKDRLVLHDEDLTLNDVTIAGGRAYFGGQQYNRYEFRENSSFRLYDINLEDYNYPEYVEISSMGFLGQQESGFIETSIAGTNEYTTYLTNNIYNPNKTFSIHCSECSIRGNLWVTGNIDGPNMNRLESTMDLLLIDSLEG